MWDGVELWLRRAGGPLLAGVFVMGLAVAREHWWLPLRVLVLLAGALGVVACGVETWRLVRGRESTEAALDRLEAEAPGRTAGDGGR
ncbi:hypothetical protein AMK26_26040 [Streptomyces sp. CB03234]|uniref:hypothetical protein n=1 Tax=Streptomyces sp. (strain CB03234) TaxID=1703937 RepID=UPI00093CBC5D|nr:hypothetical protein [Streptomyces sp. CB03234]OKJ99499.1 hypothetical protein AMK26_26040 [Streptomyces sp. CB03234]